MAAKPGMKIDTNENCFYGCGKKAEFLNKKGNLMCANFSNKCPAIKEKNSKNAKKAYETGKRISSALQYQNLPEESKRKMAWAKGLTKDTNESVLAWSVKQSGKRYVTDEEKLKQIIYREQCNFNLAGIIENVKGYSLLVNYGMYNKKSNPGGVVRDHRVSVSYGLKHGIDPKIISHPANCEFLLHSDNARKTWKNSCSLEELLRDIELWDREGKWYTLLVESQ